MCGIAGFIGNENEKVISRMAESLTHRGPDKQKVLALKGGERKVSCGYFGHRRLRVIDLSEHADQPMTSSDGRFTLVYNGEIYNFREIRKELEEQGYAFKTESDTEVLLVAYLEWGEHCLERIEGMFAFAIWDQKKHQLFLARDRLGKKPLFYTQVDGDFIFASEIKGILKYPKIRPELSPQALDDYLTYLYIPAPKTIFKGIKSLSPAHTLILSNGRIKINRYWKCKFPSSFQQVNEEEKVEQLKEILKKVVSQRLYSDVPMGAFLSGGVDSSAIVALASNGNGSQVKTFSLGFRENESNYSETFFANMVSQRYQTNHTELPAHPDLIQDLTQVIRHFDEPFGNPTALLLYHLCRETRNHVTVALGGDGGDEAFGGYPRYTGISYLQKLSHLPFWIRKSGSLIASFISEKTDGRHSWRRSREFIESLPMPVEEAYISWVNYFNFSDRTHLYSDSMRRQVSEYQGEDFLRTLFKSSEADHLLQRIFDVDMQSYLPYNLLQYLDRMSMAHGLELRTPWVDHKLIEFMAQLPVDYKIKGSKTKVLFKKALENILPFDVLNRPKMGLNPPMGIWLSKDLKDWMESILSLKKVKSRGWFDPGKIEKMKSDFYSGHRDYSLQLWGLCVLELWATEYLK